MAAEVAKIVLLMHAAGAIVLVGSVTHHAVLAYRHLRGRPVRARLQRLYARIVLWAYVPTWLLGAVLYPRFRVGVRGAYLDAAAPLATGFFEVKEHWLAIGLLIVLAIQPASLFASSREGGAASRLYGVLGLALAVIVWTSVLTGLTLVSIRSV